MGLGFGTVNEIKKALQPMLDQVTARVDQVFSTVTAFHAEVIERLTRVEAEQRAQRALIEQLVAEQRAQRALIEQLVAEQRAQRALIEQLVAEVSRFNNDSDQLLTSVYAFCHIHGVSFSHGDLFTYGGQATRYSRRHGYEIQSVRDPRFGAVNLYEPEVLERVILGFTDDDYLVKGDN
jgi:hypothetical protein